MLSVHFWGMGCKQIVDDFIKFFKDDVYFLHKFKNNVAAVVL